MPDTPKLIEAEAAILRLLSDDSVREAAARTTIGNSLRHPLSGAITDLGRSALAAYDAEQHAKIRAEAIEECARFTERQCGGAHGIDPYPVLVAKMMREQVKP